MKFEKLWRQFEYSAIGVYNTEKVLKIERTFRKSSAGQKLADQLRNLVFKESGKRENLNSQRFLKIGFEPKCLS